MAVHPDDANTAWFVPGIKDEMRIPVDGALVVTRTRDGGKTFKSLKKGLPQKHAYDLIFRQGLAIDRAGRAAWQGSTTGGRGSVRTRCAGKALSTSPHGRVCLYFSEEQHSPFLSMVGLDPTTQTSEDFIKVIPVRSELVLFPS